MADKPVRVELPADVWTAITSAGEDGTVWMGRLPDNGYIVIAHTDAGSPAGLTKEDAFRVPDTVSPETVVKITADNVDDIYYAMAVDDDGALLVDVV